MIIFGFDSMIITKTDKNYKIDKAKSNSYENFIYKKQLMKKHILPFFTILFLTACQQKQEFKSVRKEAFCLDEKFKENIEIETVKKEAVTEGIHLTGSIEANPEKVVHFASLVNGIVSKINFSFGDFVTKGQILAELQSIELSSLQAEREVLNAQIETAKTDLEAKNQLFKDGILSNKELAEAQNHLRMLESEKQKTENNLRLYSASSTKDVFQIKAPTSGIVTAKNINTGSTVTDNGEILFSVSDLNSVWAMANVYATDISSVKKGMEVEIKTISYPDEVFRGKIDLISQVLDEDAKVLKARITLDNKNLRLKPGMIADIVALKKSNENAVAVPTSCIVFFNDKNHVLVYKNDCEIEARKVEIFAKRNGTTYLKNGVNESEKIIVKNQLLIFEAVNNE